ncbi:arrestin domain-containing protein 3-like isoform X2 [Syngnathus acus]|uniref:arrestin domain-containing protein 3-like isoform X2 n=1 Tax=Syngnathus acus TaxID=161584 RepID=UPI0018862553|nr:arrestin domain-containing protein 3-like isoform X2 [Syngnathus acus]
MPITNFAIEYDAVNQQNIFTNGDTVRGRIIVEVLKETRIKSLTLIAKGKGEAHSSNEDSTFSVYDKYYTFKRQILAEARQDGETFESTKVISQGRHVFPFSFKIPDREIPSSFKCALCEIVHKIKAELKQPMKLPRKAETYFKFVSKPTMDITGLMMEGKAVSSSSKGTVMKAIAIPRRLPPSILNCSIFRLEYELKVYLDIKYTIDEGVTIPIVVLPDMRQQPSPVAFDVTPQQQATLQPLDSPPAYETLFPS